VAGGALVLAGGEGAVAKVDEHFAVLQVVHGEGSGEVAFWGVGQHQHNEPMPGFKGLSVLNRCLTASNLSGET
jgi:hypothetical protein